MTTTGNTQIPTRNVCIYCHRSGILLTDEHVVPYSLGGKHILQKASCVQCSDITKKFEQEVARDLWGVARASYNAPTRRKKERQTSVNLKDPQGKLSDLIIPVTEYPAPMIFYLMPTAGILTAEEPTKNRMSEWKLVAIMDESRKNDFLSKNPGRLTAQFKHVPKSFGRMIAKIGYCQVLTALAPGDFTPICLPYILGRKSNISYVVGGKQTNDQPIPGTGYTLRTVQVSTDDRTILLAEVRLLADNDTPTYHVVVGEVIGKENVERINAKLCGKQPETESNFISVADTKEINFKLLPVAWPLKY